MRRHPILPALLLATGCFDFGTGDPPDGPIIGTDVGNPPAALSASPVRLDLGPACPGGTRRESILLYNDNRWDVDAMAGGTPGVEAYPSAFEVDAHGSRELVVVIRLPETTAQAASGTVQVRNRLEGSQEESGPLVIPWTAQLEPGGARATVLCGEAIDCALIDFGPVFTGAVWSQPVEVVNDGCAPLEVERVIAEGSGAAIRGPALPISLLPGERWSGTLLLDPAATGTQRGSVVVVADDASAPRRIGWTATVR